MIKHTNNQLTFRDNTHHQEIRLRIFLLTAVFIGAVIFFYILLNHKPEIKVTEMSKPILPTVSLTYNGYEMNELHGYRNDMDSCYMRDTVTPLPEDRSFAFTVNTYGQEIDGISYELRSIDTTRKIADTAITDFEKKGNLISAASVLPNLLENGEEYLLLIHLKLDDSDIRYYTRIVHPENDHISNCIDFAEKFHATALSDDYSSLAPYLETNYNLDSKSLANVSIRSMLDQVGWHGFKGTEYEGRRLKLGDIGSDYVALSFDYMMTSGKETTSFYNVEEYFKVRYTKDRMYLLDYERSMEEILDPTQFAVKENNVTIGICDSDFNVTANETGTIASFVTGGDLFEYNQNTNTLTKVFSFRGKNPLDMRTNYNEHNIRILNIDENGVLDYVVYGYMNAGAHEGYCGINLYRFNPSTNTNMEEAFVVSPRPYQVLNANFSDLIYMDSNNHFYMMSDGNLVKVNLDTLEIETLLSGLKDTQYAASNSGHYIARIGSDVCDTAITIMDLEKGTSHIIQAANADDYLRPLTFLQDYIVYAILHKDDIETDAAGAPVYPAYKIVIADMTTENGEILKEFERDGEFITDVSSNNYSITMSLVKRDASGFIPTGSETIQNTSGEGNHAVDITHSEDDTRVIVTGIVLPPLSDKTELPVSSIKYANLQVADSNRTIEVPLDESILHYYVYVGSHIEFAATSLTDAIIRGDKEVGLVVDSNGNYIWKKTRAAYKNTFTGLSVGSSDVGAPSSAQALSAMLVREGENVEVNTLLEQGETPLSILSNTLKNKTVLDLTGCTLNQVLYYVNIGNPVYARTGDNKAVLLVGYDAANVVVYYPDEDRTGKIGLNDGQELFAANGSVFISYIP